ncbi:PSD1 and planctomycete cytochrome C domain-containing protein [Aporhodopirellula aestuarii]|uniref:PSD1 and planctomycete cytochrome C domain-containing protein n=1 Tax=Aporhodopirellula aestuarii TaxID=2950107 RepID=A0ABT0TXF4_9BACT|nr:PSD1 and planctomycete cytochrome C domain-containing protein [Aporhodopirellula aestuarii]MCM2369284.1 PSD1 and planctomycete cytochrome C domain-containing protein [Aporhodopirellula aestuarii]
MDYSMVLRCLAITIVLLLLNTAVSDNGLVANDKAPSFKRDIRPLLSDHCFACHGPDENKRESGIRFDIAEGVSSVIDTDDWEESSIIERIRTTDPDMIMPPPEYHKPLNESARKMLEDWVRGGAEIQAHWSFVPPVKMTPPELASDLSDGGWDNAEVDNIDRWIDAALAERSLVANGPADRTTLARRVALDLTGLPPTWEQVQRFVSDSSPHAYENYVDELIATPAYGEHMGRYWLDLVRYADTHGLHFDNYREMWPYRDWVIHSFNQNKPMDVFITEQLAGDLLPNATIEQKIASGFNRLNLTTNEGGSIYDEVFTRNVIDRTDAFGTVFIGLTTGCAVCHDHKFDPITQRDFFALSAFFNSLDGRAMDGNSKDHAPAIRIPTEEDSKKLAEIDAELAFLAEQIRGDLPEVDAAQADWLASLSYTSNDEPAPISIRSASAKSDTDVSIVDNAIVHLGEKVADKDTIEIEAELPPGTWRTLELAALTDEKHPRVGTAENGNAVLSEIVLHVLDQDSKEWMPVAIASGVASRQQTGDKFAVERAFDGKIDATQGWAVGGHESEGDRSAWFQLAAPIESTEAAPTTLRVELHYQSVHAAHALRDVRLTVYESASAIPASQKIAVSEVHVLGPISVEKAANAYDRDFAGEKADAFEPEAAVTIGEDELRWQQSGEVVAVAVNELPHREDGPSATLLHQTLHSPRESTFELMIGSDDGYVVFFNGKKVTQSRGEHELDSLSAKYELKLRKGDNHLFIKHVHHDGSAKLTYAFASRMVELSESLRQRLVAIEPNSEDAESLRRFYREVYCDSPQWLALQDMRRGMETLRKETEDKIPSTLVWKETKAPRKAHVLMRGQYDALGDVVERDVPAFLPPLAGNEKRDRLDLAKWLVDPQNPLTARVAVNRFWQQLFGTGLVKTSEDFGSQGTPPSHPELLDELAIDFRESGWDIKALMKRLVMTRAYRRDARASSEMLIADPENRLLARGPRFRLDAEVIRDQTLALSGLLVNRLGGPSVKPPQPAGLWAAVGYTGANTATFVPDEGDKVYRRGVYTFWKRTSAPAVMATFDAPSRESCTARRERTNTPLQALLLLNEPQTLEASLHLAKQVVASEETNSDARMRALFERVVLRSPARNELELLTTLLADLKIYYGNDLEQAAALAGTTDATLAAWSIVASTLLNTDEVVSK